ncbi:Imm6 family immunity protein [Bacillus licheniformis]
MLREEEDLNIARLWSLLVDAVAYTSWEAYKKEKVKYLPQALEGINNDSIIIFLNSAVETSFITPKEVEKIGKSIEVYQNKNNEIPTKRGEFLKLF